jgi:hypothetical protein
MFASDGVDYLARLRQVITTAEGRQKRLDVVATIVQEVVIGIKRGELNVCVTGGGSFYSYGKLKQILISIATWQINLPAHWKPRK